MLHSVASPFISTNTDSDYFLRKGEFSFFFPIFTLNCNSTVRMDV